MATPTDDSNSPRIVRIWILPNSQDATCKPLDDNIWTSVQTPEGKIDTTKGIGAIVSPLPISTTKFTLHDHRYKMAHIPDKYRSIVNYEFSQPVKIDQILVVQHTNGITCLEGFVGDDINNLQSVGTIWGPTGDALGGCVFPEGSLQLFDHFPNPKKGKFLRLRIKKTSLTNGYALYKIIPITTYTL
jgi:hypothetical protein